jgi:predicted permease
MWNDIRLGARLLAKDRGFTVAAVLALVIGMATSIAMFTIVHGVYFRDLPFSDPDRIVAVGTRDPTGRPDRIDGLSFPDLQDLRASATLFDGIAAADEDAMDLADEVRAAERFVGAWISADAFSLIGHRPALGRGFTLADERPGAAPVVILGHDIWTRRYRSDANILGAIVRVNGLPSTVVGIMPQGFGFPLRSQLWQPLALGGGEGRDERGNRSIDAFGRLAPGATIAQAEADLARVMERLAREFPESNATVGVIVRPFRELTTGGPIRAVFTGLMGAATFLLLIACANVGNLLLARGAVRAREFTVRLSLGATRHQVIRQLLAESLLLAVIAGLAGLGLAALGVTLLERTGLTAAPYWIQFSVEGNVFAFVAAVCFATTVLCGLAPALHTSRVSLIGMLGDGGRTTGTLRTRRWTDGLVVVQLALSLTMLVAAGLMMRNVYALSRIDAGVDTAGLMAAQVSLPARSYATEDQRRMFYRLLGEQLGALPGMRAGITSATPGRSATRRNVLLDGTGRAEEHASVSTIAIGPGYMEALDIAPLRGRLFTAADDDVAARVVVVNERFAAVRLPGEEALGRTVWLESDTPRGLPHGPLTIVGVVPNMRHASARQQTTDGTVAEPVLYLTYASTPLPSATIVVRSNAGAGAVATALRQVLAALDADLPLAGTVIPLDEATTQELGILAMFGSIFGLFASAALGLATVGLYGITAYAVAQRTRELGVRLALGARARHVWWVVTRRAAMQLAIGISLGLAGAVGAGQLLQAALMGVSGRDPIALIGVPALMVVVVLVACFVPAARAMRVDPIAALRVE